MTNKNTNLTEHIKHIIPEIVPVIIGAGTGIAGYVLVEKLISPSVQPPPDNTGKNNPTRLTLPPPIINEWDNTDYINDSNPNTWSGKSNVTGTYNLVYDFSSTKKLIVPFTAYMYENSSYSNCSLYLYSSNDNTNYTIISSDSISGNISKQFSHIIYMYGRYLKLTIVINHYAGTTNIGINDLNIIEI